MAAMSMSPSTRRTRRGREGFVLDNVTAAPFVTNDIEPGRFAVDICPGNLNEPDYCKIK